MTQSLRQVLYDSHIAAVTIAVLLLWSLDGAFRALWAPVYHALRFLITAIAIFDIPYISPGVNLADRLTLITAFTHLYAAIASFSAAWLLSRWVYGQGPVRSLTRYSKSFIRRKHV